jgi:hypothetical protein
MMQLTGRAASNQLTFSCSVEGVATMETAGVRRDSWRAHVIAKSRSYRLHAVRGKPAAPPVIAQVKMHSPNMRMQIDLLYRSP